METVRLSGEFTSPLTHFDADCFGPFFVPAETKVTVDLASGAKLHINFEDGSTLARDMEVGSHELTFDGVIREAWAGVEQADGQIRWTKIYP